MICEPSNFSALEFQTKCSRKLIAFELLEDITNKLVIRICHKAFLIDLKFVLARYQRTIQWYYRADQELQA